MKREHPRSMIVNAKTMEIVVALHSIFHDFDKVSYWLRTKNLNLGGCAPLDLIHLKRADKVLEFIKYANDTYRRVY